MLLGQILKIPLLLKRSYAHKEFISEFLKFREDTVIKRVKFDLKKAEERAHILIGLATAVENIDEIYLKS